MGHLIRKNASFWCLYENSKKVGAKICVHKSLDKREFNAQFFSSIAAYLSFFWCSVSFFFSQVVFVTRTFDQSQFESQELLSQFSVKKSVGGSNKVQFSTTDVVEKFYFPWDDNYWDISTQISKTAKKCFHHKMFEMIKENCLKKSRFALDCFVFQILTKKPRLPASRFWTLFRVQVPSSSRDQ